MKMVLYPIATLLSALVLFGLLLVSIIPLAFLISMGSSGSNALSDLRLSINELWNAINEKIKQAYQTCASIYNTNR